MMPIQVGDRVVIAGTHVAAGREGNVSYVGESFDQLGVTVCFDGDEEYAPFIEVGSGAWLTRVDGPVVMPARYVGVPVSRLQVKSAQVKRGDTVTLPECAGKWSYFVGIVARVGPDTCWIRLP